MQKGATVWLFIQIYTKELLRKLLQYTTIFCDKKTAQNFDSLSKRYLKNMEEEINRQMNGLMLQNLQGMTRPMIMPQYQLNSDQSYAFQNLAMY